jgi:hypothetical protein
VVSIPWQQAFPSLHHHHQPTPTRHWSQVCWHIFGSYQEGKTRKRGETANQDSDNSETPRCDALRDSFSELGVLHETGCRHGLSRLQQCIKIVDT